MALCPCGLYAQKIDLRDWAALSETNQNAPPADTVFDGKPSVKLDGHAVAVIWNKKVNVKNFRLDVDIAGTVMAGLWEYDRGDPVYSDLQRCAQLGFLWRVSGYRRFAPVTVASCSN